jgi:hypothetical protein
VWGAGELHNYMTAIMGGGGLMPQPMVAKMPIERGELGLVVSAIHRKHVVG